MVHVPAGKHRHRRRAGHGMPGQRHGPVQGKLHPRRGAEIELPASLRQGLRQGRLHRHPERKREALKSKDPVGEGGTKVPTVRLDHASPQAVCRDTRLAQLSPACSPGSVALMSSWRERKAQPIGSMATLPGSSGHPLF